MKKIQKHSLSTKTKNSAAKDKHVYAELNALSADTLFFRGRVKLGRGYRRPKKYLVEAVECLRRAARKNHAEAQFTLGACYAEGLGVRKNKAGATKWWHKAAEQNEVKAQFWLGVHYYGIRYSNYSIKIMAEAAEWFRRAAEQNFAAAQYNLGLCYAQGRGVEEDEVEAAKWWHKAAEQNDSEAQSILGVCYANGKGVTRDWAEAYKWAILAAKRGDKRAQYMVKMTPQDVLADQIAEGTRRAKEWREQRHEDWSPLRMNSLCGAHSIQT
ncbi:MAG: sel1 repeat family protein [Verrucomicrobia bacterium]|nr:sel1 repeat family protein [Verrucomicrobiota bacterium]